MNLRIKNDDVNLLLKSLDVHFVADGIVSEFFGRLEEEIRNIQEQKLSEANQQSEQYTTLDKERYLKRMGIGISFLHPEKGFVFGEATTQIGTMEWREIPGVVLYDAYFKTDVYTKSYEAKLNKLNTKLCSNI